MKNFFIHIPKCGGMTIRRAPELKNVILTCNEKMLKSHQYALDLKDTMERNGDHHGIEHARFIDINADLRKKHTFFSIVRNPWSRTVSRFMFAKKVIKIEKKSPTKYANISSFEAFLEERHLWGNKEFMWHRAIRGWYNCFDYVVDENKNVKCDILRFENYDEDASRYFNLSQSKLKPRNVTGYMDLYQNYYNEKTIQIVANWYKRDIEFFGYDFDKGPSKNFYFRSYE